MLEIKKHRMTKQRQVILDELRKLDTHPNADEIYQVVKKKIPNISLGTVYRNLEMLHECGLIRKLEIAGKQKRFDGDTQEHYHVRCIYCDKIKDIHCSRFNLEQLELESDIDFEIVGYNLEFFGLCPECKKKCAENVDKKGEWLLPVKKQHQLG